MTENEAYTDLESDRVPLTVTVYVPTL